MYNKDMKKVYIRVCPINGSSCKTCPKEGWYQLLPNGEWQYIGKENKHEIPR